MNSKPNILFIMTDQWNAECFSAFFHPDVRTPNIDGLIEGGVSFRNCFSANPICQPSRVSFLTGQYPHTHGVITNNSDVSPKSVNNPLARELKEKAGYRTGAFGKLHIGVFEEEAGFDRIEHVCDNPFGEAEYRIYLREKGLLKTFLDTEKNPDAQQYFSAGTSGLKACDSNEAWTADRTIDFIKEGAEPFLAWCTFERPHAPHTPPADAPVQYAPKDLTIPPYDPQFFESKTWHGRAGCENLWKAWVMGEDALRESLAKYYTLMSLIDSQVGRIVDCLESSGKLEDTIIIFTADHGDFAGTQGMLGKNTCTYDALIRSPYIWYWKGHFDRNMHFDLCETIDMYPTLCDVIGIDTPPSVQGTSHIDALNDLPYYSGKEYVFSERALTRTVRSRTHKMSVTTDGRRHFSEMYDIIADPEENSNIFGRPDSANIRAELMEELIAWTVRTDQPCCFSNSSQKESGELKWHKALRQGRVEPPCGKIESEGGDVK